MCAARQEVNVFTSKSQEYPYEICRDLEWPRNTQQEQTQDDLRKEKLKVCSKSEEI